MGDLWQKWWTLFSFSSCPLILHFSLLTPSSPLLVSRSFSFFTLWTLFYSFSLFFCVTIWRWSKSQLHTLVYICSNGTPLYRRHRWNYGMNTSVLRHSSPELLPFVWDFCFPSPWHGIVFGGRFFFFFSVIICLGMESRVGWLLLFFCSDTLSTPPCCLLIWFHISFLLQTRGLAFQFTHVSLKGHQECLVAWLLCSLVITITTAGSVQRLLITVQPVYNRHWAGFCLWRFSFFHLTNLAVLI